MAGDTEKLPQIQVARAIAALMVVYFHSKIALRSIADPVALPIPFLNEHGYFGVNLFFCISGYIIGLVCERPGFAPGSFLIRRFFRIYPVFWLFLLVTLLLYWLGFWPPVLPFNDPDYVLANFALFPIQEQSIYEVSWTLEHEVIFYLLAALMVPLAGVAALFRLIVVLALIGLLAPPPVWDFHLFAHAHIDFASGLLVYLLRKRIPALGVAVPLILCAGLYALAVRNVSYSGSAGHMMLLIALLNIPAALAERQLKPLVAIGDASYSLYLLHWLVMNAMYKVAVRWLDLPDWAAEPYRILALLISVTGALFLYRYLERPAIAFGRRLTSVRTPRPA